MLSSSRDQGPGPSSSCSRSYFVEGALEHLHVLSISVTGQSSQSQSAAAARRPGINERVPNVNSVHRIHCILKSVVSGFPFDRHHRYSRRE